MWPAVEPVQALAGRAVGDGLLRVGGGRRRILVKLARTGLPLPPAWRDQGRGHAAGAFLDCEALGAEEVDIGAGGFVFAPGRLGVVPDLVGEPPHAERLAWSQLLALGAGRAGDVHIHPIPPWSGSRGRTARDRNSPRVRTLSTREAEGGGNEGDIARDLYWLLIGAGLVAAAAPGEAASYVQNTNLVSGDRRPGAAHDSSSAAQPVGPRPQRHQPDLDRRSRRWRLDPV